MKKIVLLALFSIHISCTSVHDNLQLNGTWLPISQTIGGNSMPASMFDGHRLTIDNDSYTMQAESIDKGNITINKGKMDIYGKEGVNQGKHFMAIYKIEDDKLTVCYDLTGESYPTEFESASNPMFLLSVFKLSEKD